MRIVTMVTAAGLALGGSMAGAAEEPAFVSARRIINGTDRALAIARHAGQFQQALALGGW